MLTLGSPIVRRVGQGDIGSAVQEALKAVSQQTKQVADALDAASQEQTGATVQQHLRRGQEAAETVASAVSERTQGRPLGLTAAFSSVARGIPHQSNSL